MDWQLILTIASILTAIGVIYGFVKKWGKAIAKLIVQFGLRQLSEADIQENPHMKGHYDLLLSLQTEIRDQMALLAKELQDNTKLTLKLELKELFRNYPEKVDTIEETMKEYHAVHGNSYIDAMYEDWKKTYVQGMIDKENDKKGGM